MRIKLTGTMLLSAVILTSCGWLMFYARGAVGREADGIMDGQVRYGFFSGAVLVSKGDKVLFEHAYGFADVEHKVRNTLQTRFRIGSISKIFTAIIVMQLAGEHRLALTDPICEYLTQCPIGWSAIELHHLLSHTSGIHNYTVTKPGEPTIDRILATPHTQAQILARFIDEPLAFPPGTKFEYSNSNYWLLAHVIEEVTGLGYEQVLTRRILEPIGMHDSGLTHDWPTTASAAVGYRTTRQGQIERAPVVDGSWSSADGGIYSTVLDLQKFSSALDNDRLISRATLARMQTPVRGDYGYGWSTAPAGGGTRNHRQAGHGGSLPGFLSYFERFEAAGITVIALSNNQSSDPEQVVRGLGSVVFKEPFRPTYARESVEVSAAVLQHYVGDYDLNGVTWTVFLVDGHLHVRDKDERNGPDFELLAESEDILFIPRLSGSITPIENGKGEVSGLSVVLGDRSYVLKKLR